MTEAWESLIVAIPHGWWYRSIAIPLGIALLTLPIGVFRRATDQITWGRRFLMILAAQIPALLVLPTTLIAWKPAYFLAWIELPLHNSPSGELHIVLGQLVHLALVGVGLTVPVILYSSRIDRLSGLPSSVRRITKTFTAISTQIIGMRRGAIVETAPFGVLTIQSGIRSGMIEAVRPNAIIGTHGDIPLPDESVSRRHAQLHIHDNIVMISDLGSRNGTFLGRNQQTVPLDNRLHPLQNGDRLILGDPASASAIILMYHQEHR